MWRKKTKTWRDVPQAALCDPFQIIGEFAFLDNEKVIFGRFDQPKVTKSLHEKANPWPCRAHHLGQFFMSYDDVIRASDGAYFGVTSKY